LPLDFREEGGHWRYDADYHERPRRPGSDVDVCFGGKIAVTLLSI
jgi:5'-nucleotidase